jgi:hypothetical protein
MRGYGFFKHLGKDNFEVSNVGEGRDIPTIKVKLLKSDMQTILKLNGINDSGKKPEILAKFIDLIKLTVTPKPAMAQAFVEEPVKDILPAHAAAPAAAAPTTAPYVFNRKLFRNNKPSVLKPNYKYVHRFSERAGDYPEGQILQWVADENSDDYLNDKEKNAKRYAVNKIMNAKNERNKSLYGIWVINGENYDNVKKKWEGE